MTTAARFIGIDVAQATLVVAAYPAETGWSVANDAAGVATLQHQLEQRSPTLIVLEATGGLERLVASTLGAAGLPVAVVNPRQVRDCAKATGRLAKTDALDAQVLVHFAAAVQPAPRPLPDQQTAEHVGGPECGAGGLVHGSADRHTLPGADPGVLPAALRGRQSEASGAGGLHAESC